MTGVKSTSRLRYWVSIGDARYPADPGNPPAHEHPCLPRAHTYTCTHTARKAHGVANTGAKGRLETRVRLVMIQGMRCMGVCVCVQAFVSHLARKGQVSIRTTWARCTCKQALNPSSPFVSSCNAQEGYTRARSMHQCKIMICARSCQSAYTRLRRRESGEKLVLLPLGVLVPESFGECLKID